MYQTNENNAQNSFSVRTDLAIEARELAQQNAQAADQLEGVDVETKEDPIIFSPMYASIPKKEAASWANLREIISHLNQKS